MHLPFNKRTSVEKVSLNELLDSERFQPYSDQSDVVGFQLGQDVGDLSRRQSTIGSSEPAKEYDDASLILPQVFERHLLNGKKLIIHER